MLDDWFVKLACQCGDFVCHLWKLQEASERPREHLPALRWDTDSFPGSVNYTASSKLYVTGVDKACKPAGQPSHYLAVTEKLRAVFFFFFFTCRPFNIITWRMLRWCHTQWGKHGVGLTLVSEICWYAEKKACVSVWVKNTSTRRRFHLFLPVKLIYRLLNKWVIFAL